MLPTQSGTLHFGQTFRVGKVDDLLSQQRIKPEIEFLTSSEVSQLDAIVSEYKGLEYKYRCSENILEILKKLPDTLSQKLKVIIATHEEYGLMTYFYEDYFYHVFLLAKTENGIIIFDPRMPNATNMKSNLWITSVYRKAAIKYALTDEYTIQYLPQFRILDRTTYIDQYKSATVLSTRCPEYTLRKNNQDALQSPLWKNSFCINLYEICQFFTGHVSYEDTMENHKYLQSPLARLKSEHIAYLRQFFLD